jgi:hypothetical protein
VFWVFSLYVGGAFFGVPQEGLRSTFCLFAAAFFCVCWGVGTGFSSHAVHGSMLNPHSCECGGAWKPRKNPHATGNKDGKKEQTIF